MVDTGTVDAPAVSVTPRSEGCTVAVRCTTQPGDIHWIGHSVVTRRHLPDGSVRCFATFTGTADRNDGLGQVPVDWDALDVPPVLHEKCVEAADASGRWNRIGVYNK